MSFQTPGEFAAHLQEHAEQRRMAIQNYEHSETEFLAKLSTVNGDEVDTTQLKTFQMMLRRMQSMDWYVPYMLGRVDHLLLMSGVCTCGEDHDADLQGLLAEDEAKNLVKTIRAEVPIEGTPEQRDEYGMEWVQDPLRSDASSILRCANCKKPSVSMADRMLRAPKDMGCDGCHMKYSTGATFD